MKTIRINGEDTIYGIDKDGTVFNLTTGRRRKTQVDDMGREYLLLRHDGRYHNRKVSRLLAESYLGNIEGKIVHHRNLCKNDNSLPNLLITDQSYDKDARCAITFTVVSPSGEIITSRNLKEFCLKNDLNYPSMNRLVNRKIHKGFLVKSHKGWTLYKE